MTKVNQDKCIGCGACAAMCPDGFEIKGGKAQVKNESACSKDAISICPVNAITA